MWWYHVYERERFTSPEDIYTSYRKFAEGVGVKPLSFENWSLTTFKLDAPQPHDEVRDWLDGMTGDGPER